MHFGKSVFVFVFCFLSSYELIVLHGWIVQKSLYLICVFNFLRLNEWIALFFSQFRLWCFTMFVLGEKADKHIYSVCKLNEPNWFVCIISAFLLSSLTSPCSSAPWTGRQGVRTPEISTRSLTSYWQDGAILGLMSTCKLGKNRNKETPFLYPLKFRMQNESLQYTDDLDISLCGFLYGQLLSIILQYKMHFCYKILWYLTATYNIMARSRTRSFHYPIMVWIPIVPFEVNPFCESSPHPSI